MAAKKKPKIVAVQLPADLQVRVEKFHTELAKKSPTGQTVTASDALRVLLEIGLAHA